MDRNFPALSVFTLILLIPKARKDRKIVSGSLLRMACFRTIPYVMMPLSFTRVNLLAWRITCWESRQTLFAFRLVLLMTILRVKACAHIRRSRILLLRYFRRRPLIALVNIQRNRNVLILLLRPLSFLMKLPFPTAKQLNILWQYVVKEISGPQVVRLIGSCVVVLLILFLLVKEITKSKLPLMVLTLIAKSLITKKKHVLLSLKINLTHNRYLVADG